MTNTLAGLLQAVTVALKPHSDSARRDAEWLVMHACHVSRARLYADPTHPVTREQTTCCMAWCQRRISGEPVAYLIGTQDFWRHTFTVTPDVLIPRPDTEALIEWLLAHTDTTPCHLADLGVGCGTLALSIALERPNWQVDASDQSAAALTVAQQNAARLHVHNVRFYQGSWCAALPEPTYDIIISNPPYLAADDPHHRALRFEPLAALTAGATGMEAIQAIVEQAYDRLKPNGLLIVEHGHDQREDVLALLNNTPYQAIEDHTDLNGTPRFFTAKKGPCA